jgi:hypothetical protein
VSGQIYVHAALPPEKAFLVPIGLEGGWVPDPFCGPVSPFPHTFSQRQAYLSVN